MKKINQTLFMLIISAVLVVLVSCVSPSKNVEITSKLPENFQTAETLAIDFTLYFEVSDPNNPNAKVTKDMIDTSKINCKLPGTYPITINYPKADGTIGTKTFSVTFVGESFEDEFINLDTPTNINVRNNQDLSAFVTFTKSVGASSYEIIVYQNTNIVLRKNVSGDTSITLKEAGSYELTVQAIGDDVTYKTSEVSSRVIFTVTNESTFQLTTFETHLQNRLKELGDAYFGSGIPSLGNPKVLVIPVQFSNYTLDRSGYTVSEIEKAFFGTSEDTGFESLKSYYHKSSYGKLTIDGDVLAPYTANEPANYYANKYNQYGIGDEIILEEVLNYYDDTIDFSEYDYDKDGSIDGIYLIYSCPQEYYESSIWWAWQTFASYNGVEDFYDGVQAGYYMWASVQFFAENVDAINGYDKFGQEAKPGLLYNTHTIIHETGHMLGLDDYYDYPDSPDNPDSFEIGPTGGLGGADMMDLNVGDHNPFSKMMLGWVNPIVVLRDATLTINSFTETGQCLMIPKNFEKDGYFGEYLTIDLYTPTGLNEFDKSELFTISGVRIMQVDSGFNYDYDFYQDRSVFYFNNSDTEHKIIRYIEADGVFHIEKTTAGRDYFANNNDLFVAGDVFEAKATYWKTLTWYDGSLMDFSITIVKIANNQATITIDFK